MPVDEIPVHHKVKHTDIKAGCHSHTADSLRPGYETFAGEYVRHNLTYVCRQIGRKFNGAWIPLDECMGCTSIKDEPYIEKARTDIDREMAKFMRADQR